jgi:hypothetical protein
MSNQELFFKALKEIDGIAWDEYKDSDGKLASIQSILYQVEMSLDGKSMQAEMAQEDA